MSRHGCQGSKDQRTAVSTASAFAPYVTQFFFREKDPFVYGVLYAYAVVASYPQKKQKSHAGM